MEKSIIEVIKHNPTKYAGAKQSFICSDNVERFPQELSRWAKRPWETMKKRMILYGPYSPLVFYDKGRIPKSLSDPARALYAQEKGEPAEQKIDSSEDEWVRGAEIQPNAVFDDKYYPLPPAATDGSYCYAAKRAAKTEEIEEMSNVKAKELLEKFNKKAMRKGLLSRGDFLAPVPKRDVRLPSVMHGVISVGGK